MHARKLSLIGLFIFSTLLACSGKKDGDSDTAGVPAEDEAVVAQPSEPELDAKDQFLALCQNTGGEAGEQQFANYLLIELQARAQNPELDCEAVYTYYNTPKAPGTFGAQLSLRAVPAFAGLPFPGLTAIRYLTEVEAVLIDGVEITDWSVFASATKIVGMQISSSNLATIPEEWSALTSLAQILINNVGAIDLAGLKNLPALVSVGTYNSAIADHAALGEATGLEEIVTGATGLTVIPESWNNLAELAFLAIESEPLTDISALKDNKKLEALEIYDARITDFSSIVNLTGLRSLYLELSGITALPAGFASLVELQQLVLKNEALVSLANLDGVAASLLSLEIEAVPLADFTQLNSLTLLQRLVVGQTGLTEIPAGWSALTALQTLVLFTEEAFDLSNAANLTSLATLAAIELGLVALPDLAALVNLQVLDLSFNDGIDLTNLNGINPNVQTIYLDGTGLVAVPALAALTGLDGLSISTNTTLTDYTSLVNHPSITVVLAAGNAIAEIPAALASIPNLTGLGLAANAVVDVNSIGGIATLNALDVRNNPIVNTRNAANCPADALSPAVKAFCTPAP